MAKVKQKGLRDIDLKYYKNEKKIRETNIGDYNRNGMRIYGANVQLGRAIPNIVDGFKPVARRVLYAMCKLEGADKREKKVLSISGSIVKIHPHGETSAQESLKNLSKPWEYNYPLVSITGNNGTPKGDEAAASRYLDASISKYCYDCYFKEWDNSLVDMVPSYNPEYDEPTVLPSAYPDLLVRPTTGFTFGITSNIPSFNLGEAFNAVIKLIKHPKYNPVLIPDMPSGCIILDEGNFETLCSTGKGSFKMRAEINVDEESHKLIVTSLPYHVKLDDIKEVIDKLRETEFPTLVNMFDGSNMYGVFLELDFTKETDLELMKYRLYKKTKLQDSFATQMNYVDMQQGKVFLYSLKAVMNNWIYNRRIIKRKYMINKLVRDKEKLHITEVLLAICEDSKFLDALIKLIKKSNKDEIVNLLHSKFGDKISTVQALGIAKMKLSDLSKSAKAQYKLDIINLKSEIKELDATINDHEKIDDIIIEELRDAIKKYNQPRKCRVEKYSAEDDKPVISDKSYQLVFSKKGFVKKLPADTKTIGDLNNGDEPIICKIVKNTEKIVFFDAQGMCHVVLVNDIPECKIKDTGVSLSRFVHTSGEVIQIFTIEELEKLKAFIFITKNGTIKKTEISNFTFNTSVSSILLKDGDELVSVITIKNDIDIMVFTKGGYGSRYNTGSFSATGRSAYGVIGIDMKENDEVAGVSVIGKKDTHMMVVTEKGNFKMFTLESTNANANRRDQPLIITNTTLKNPVVNVISCTTKDKFFVISKDSFNTVDASEIAILTRNHIAPKLLPMRKGNKIVSIGKITKK